MAKKKRKKTEPADAAVNDDAQSQKPATKAQMAPEKRTLKKGEEEDDLIIFSDLTDITAKERVEIGKYVADEVRKVIQSREWGDHIKMINYSWDAYEQKVEARTLPYPDAPNVRVDLDASITEGYVSRMLAANFDVDPIVHMEGEGPEDVAKAPKLEQYMQWYHKRKLDLYSIAETGFLRKTIEGHQVNMLLWDRDYEMVRMMRRGAVFSNGRKERTIFREDELEETMTAGFEPTGEVKTVVSDEQVMRFDGPKPIPVEGKDYVFPIAETPMDGKPAWEARQLWPSAGDIQRKVANRIYYKDSWRKIQNHPHEREVLVSRDNEDEQKPAEKIVTGQFRMIQWYGPYRRKKDPYPRKYLFTIHYDTEMLVRAQHHPYNHGKSPFIHNRLFHNRGYWGFGVPWAIRHLTWVASEMVNQMLGSGFLANALNFKYKKGAFDPDAQPFIPGKGVAVKNMADFEELNIGGRRIMMDLSLLRTIREMAETRVGYGKLQSGQPDSRQKTARGVMALLKEGALTFDKTIRSDQRWLEEITDQEVQMFQQFMPIEGARFRDLRQSVERLFAGKTTSEDLFPQMRPSDISGNYDFIAMGSSHAATKELDLQMNMFLYETLKENFVVKSSPESYYKLTKNILSAARKKEPILPPLNEFLASVQKNQEAEGKREQVAKALQAEGANPQELEQVMATMDAQGKFSEGGQEGELPPLSEGEGG